MDPKRERWILGAILALAFGLRAIHPYQPIVENYVGRQIPTAMVARNIQRTGMFFRPSLDTLPSPNYFVIEPPLYAATVARLSSLTRLPIEPTGRLVSALGVVLACWGLYGLARPREGIATALLAIATFALFPVMIRYGRAFQPDSLMLGLVLVGMWGWDRAIREDGRPWLAASWLVLAIGLAMKAISAYLLLPLLIPLIRRGRYPMAVLLLATLLPATLWYGWAYYLVSNTRIGSGAQAQSFEIWRSALFSTALWSGNRLSNLIRFVTIRCFTPLGSVMGVLGWFTRPAVDPFWATWAIGLAGMFLVVSGKIHHEYYWMAAAPLLAIGLSRSLVAYARQGKWFWFGTFSLTYVVASLALSLSTFQTPREWQGIERLGRIVRDEPDTGRIVAQEAVIYYCDTTGYRLEFDTDAVSRAADEFVAHSPGERAASDAVGEPQTARDALDLIDLYLRPSSQIRVIGLEDDDPKHVALREALRHDPRGRFREWPGVGWIWNARRGPR